MPGCLTTNISGQNHPPIANLRRRKRGFVEQPQTDTPLIYASGFSIHTSCSNLLVVLILLPEAEKTHIYSGGSIRAAAEMFVVKIQTPQHESAQLFIQSCTHPSSPHLPSPPWQMSVLVAPPSMNLGSEHSSYKEHQTITKRWIFESSVGKRFLGLYHTTEMVGENTIQWFWFDDCYKKKYTHEKTSHMQ